MMRRSADGTVPLESTLVIQRQVSVIIECSREERRETAMQLAAVQLKTAPTLSYSVLLQPQAEGGWLARVLGWEDCQVQAESRDTAIANLLQKFQAMLASIEVVQFEVSVKPAINPLLALAGKYQDDPDFAEVIGEMAAYRRSCP